MISDADRLARSRLLALTLVRLAGIVLMFLGLLIAQTDLLRAGGWPAVGISLAVIGFVASLFLPKLAASKWRTPKDR